MSGGEKKQLGRILLQQKAVSPQQLDDLLKEQKAHPEMRLASVAAASGMVSEQGLLKALSEQHGVPGLDLAQLVVPLENLQLLPHEIARQHAILPILVKEDRLFLAMADPSDRRVVDEIEFVTGRRVFPYVALHEPLVKLVDDCYRLAERGETYYVGPRVPPEYLREIGLDPALHRPAADARPSVPPDPLPGGKVSAVVVPAPPPPPKSAASPKASPAPTPAGPTGAAGPPSASSSARGAPAKPAAADDEISFAGLLDDDEPASPGASPAAATPSLDDAFASRVAPLPTSPGTPASPRRAPSGTRVLVVDDEDDIRRLLRRVLVERGYDVVEAAKGLEALALVRDQTPDVIVLDAMLPEVHGFDICRRIKGSKRYGHIPIVMVSAIYRGWRFAQDLRESYGVDVFLEKPFKVSDVVGAIERAVAGRAGEHHDPDEQLSEEAREALQAGLAAFKAGDLDAAIDHLRRGVGIDPLAYKLHYHLGLLYGRRDTSVFEAIQAMETAVDLSPRSFHALKNLAVLYQRAGFKHRSVEMWERALHAAPDDETRRGIKDHLVGLL
jgi:CheY-like chemotaxis protein